MVKVNWVELDKVKASNGTYVNAYSTEAKTARESFENFLETYEKGLRKELELYPDEMTEEDIKTEMETMVNFLNVSDPTFYKSYFTNMHLKGPKQIAENIEWVTTESSYATKNKDIPLSLQQCLRVIESALNY
jgi:hypothetical protein